MGEISMAKKMELTKPLEEVKRIDIIRKEIGEIVKGLELQIYKLRIQNAELEVDLKNQHAFCNAYSRQRDERDAIIVQLESEVQRFTKEKQELMAEIKVLKQVIYEFRAQSPQGTD